MDQKHYGYGSGISGCLYDNGPNYSGTNKRQAAYGALFIFEDELTQEEYSEAVEDLVNHGFHRFPKDRQLELGAQIVEVFEVDPKDFKDEIEE